MIDAEKYVAERVLKQRDDSAVLLVRDRSNGHRSVFREYRGDGAVYEKLQGVACSCLPRVEQVSQADGVVQVLEEYVQGDVLEDLLQGCRMTVDEAVSVGVQLCRALTVLHDMGVVHRDVKPTNIILQGERVVLIDFDAARVQKAQQDMDTRVMGTTGYAAPEQYGFSQTDGRTDLYAMGVLLNVMLTGEHPSRKLVTGPMQKVVETCIQVNADKRYASAAALEKALMTVGKPKKRRWIGATAALLAGFAIAAVWLRPSQELSAPPVEEPQQEVSEPLPEPAAVPGFVPETEEPLPEAEVPQLEPEPDPLQQALQQQRTYPERYWMEFRWDSDGDGTEETYRFGALVEGLTWAPLEIDNVGCVGNDRNYRCVAPGVWRCNADGSLTLAEELSDLLVEPKTRIYPIEQIGSELPPVRRIDPILECWDGAVSMEQSVQCAGTWLVEVTATFDGKPLTGAVVSNVGVFSNAE